MISPTKNRLIGLIKVQFKELTKDLNRDHIFDLFRLKIIPIKKDIFHTHISPIITLKEPKGEMVAIS